MYQLITECTYSSLCLCRPCGESHSISHMTLNRKKINKIDGCPFLFADFALFLFFCQDHSPFTCRSLTSLYSHPSPPVKGRRCSLSIRHARWPDVTTTSQAACSSPGSATIRAGSPLTRHSSTSGTPCRMCSHTALIRPCSSLMCRYPDQNQPSVFDATIGSHSTSSSDTHSSVSFTQRIA